MRHQWQAVLAIIVLGVVLGLAVGGLPNHRSDAPLRRPSTTASVAPSSTVGSTAP